MFNSDEEKLRKLLDKLNAKASNAIIVVEGKKDRDALESIGIRSDFFLLNKNKRSLQDCAEQLTRIIEKSDNSRTCFGNENEQVAQTHNQAILLLDQDKKGQELAKKLKACLQKVGVKVNTKLGEQILKVARQRTVESIEL